MPRRVVAYDKRTGEYVEELRYPDGRTVRMEDRLTEHTGHGTDKPELREARAAAKAAKEAQRTANKRIRDQAYREGKTRASRRLPAHRSAHSSERRQWTQSHTPDTSSSRSRGVSA